jgi:DNA-binding NtrC family response regulator
MPPLRQREGDITGLAQYFLNTLNEKHDTEIAFTKDALQALQLKPWPGNVRELKNYVERAYIMSESVIDVAALPETEIMPSIARGTAETPSDEKQIEVPVGATLADAERTLIFASLERHGGDKKSAAAELGISLKTLYNRLRDYSDPVDSEQGANDAASP